MSVWLVVPGTSAGEESVPAVMVDAPSAGEACEKALERFASSDLGYGIPCERCESFAATRFLVFAAHSPYVFDLKQMPVPGEGWQPSKADQP